MPAILGHHAPLETLRTAVRIGRMHHALILSGPPGVGKCTVALELARVLLDPESDPATLGQGAAVMPGHLGRLLEAGTHPDLHLIRKEDAAYSDSRSTRERKQMNISLDLLRERLLGGTGKDGQHRQPAIGRTSNHDAGKVFIIDEAELIDPPGQNALLKTLEEPPPDTWIMLVSSRPERLLPTVRSRCEHVRFGPLSDDDMRQWIQDSCPELPDVEWMLDWAEGGPGMIDLANRSGLKACADDLAPLISDLDDGRWSDEIGPRISSFMADWSETVVKANKSSSKDMVNKQGAGLVLRLLGQHIRRQLLSVDAGEIDRGSNLWSLANVIAQTEDQLQRGLNSKQVIEGMVAAWSQQNAPTV